MFDVRGIAAGVRHKRANPPKPPVPAAGSFPMSTQGAGDFLYSSGNLNDPNRAMVPIEEDVVAPDYMQIFNDMLSSMTRPAPTMSFDASPFQAAMGQVNQQAGINRGAIGQTQEQLMAQLAQLKTQQGEMGVQDLAKLQGAQAGVNQNIQGAINPVAADLAAQGVQGVPLGGGARAAALAGQQAGQTNRMNVGQQAAMSGLDARAASGTALGQSANQALDRNAQSALATIQHDQAQAQTKAQNEYIRALNSYQNQQAGNAKQVLNMIASVMPGDDNAASAWAGKSGPTADKVAGAFASFETGDMDPETLIGQYNTKQWVPKLGPDGKQEKGSDGKPKQVQLTGWEALRQEGVDVEAYKKALRDYNKPPKATKQQKAINAIYGGR